MPSERCPRCGSTSRRLYRLVKRVAACNAKKHDAWHDSPPDSREGGLPESQEAGRLPEEIEHVLSLLEPQLDAPWTFRTLRAAIRAYGQVKDETTRLLAADCDRLRRELDDAKGVIR